MEDTDKDKDPLSKEMIIKRLRFITIFTLVYLFIAYGYPVFKEAIYSFL